MNTHHPVDQLPDHVAGRVPPETAAAIEEHVAECSACAAELAELRALAEALAPEREVEPRPDTFDAIIAGLDRLDQASPDEPDPERPDLRRDEDPPTEAPPAPVVDLAAARRSRRPIAVALGAAAAAVIAFVAISVSIGDDADSPPVAAPALDAEPDLVLLSAADVAEQVETVRFTSEGTVEILGTDLLITGEGRMAAPDRAQVEVTMEATGVLAGVIPETRIEQVTVGDEIRSRQDGGPWQEGAGAFDVDLPNVEEPARALRNAAERAEELDDGGVVTIDGVETREVSFTVPAELMGLDLLLEPDAPVRMTVYVMEDSRLRRAVVHAEGDITRPTPTRMVMDLTTDYFDHDEPVDIVLPPVG